MHYKSGMETSLTIRLDSDLANLLEEASERTQLTRGEIVREAVRKQLKENAGNKAGGLMKYAGAVSGPRDLSTNKKYLAGMGRRRKARA